MEISTRLTNDVLIGAALRKKAPHLSYTLMDIIDRGGMEGIILRTYGFAVVRMEKALEEGNQSEIEDYRTFLNILEPQVNRILAQYEELYAH